MLEIDPVTLDIVWEYISPYWGRGVNNNRVYRAYRVPYDWIPQLARPEEIPVLAVDVTRLRQPAATARGRFASVVEVAGVSRIAEVSMRSALGITRNHR